jgi:DNA-binding CsgD family transcriptional regulator
MIEHAFTQAPSRTDADRHFRGPIAAPLRMTERRSFLSGPGPLPQDDCTSWFEHDGLARFVLNAQGAIQQCNAAGRAMIASGMVGAGGAFLCQKHRNRPEFDSLLARLNTHRQPSGRVLFRSGDDDWCLLDLIALPDVENKIFATARPAQCVSTEGIESLRAVFGLTRAEITVLSHLTCGEPPKEIGRQMDVSIHTVRAHLRAICMRMGVKGINGALRLSFQLTTT